MVDWWSDVELWLSGIPFPFQFALVIGILAPLCLVVAWLIDRAVDHASALLGTSRAQERPLGGSEPRGDDDDDDGTEDDGDDGDDDDEEPAGLVSAANASE